jgi:hypothetical protein
MIKLWIDDVRPMPVDFTHCCINASSAIEFIKANSENIFTISFDHDLSEFIAETELTGNTVAKYIEEALYFNEIKIPNQVTFLVHSSNSTGRANIVATLKSAGNYTSSIFTIKETPYETFYR